MNDRYLAVFVAGLVLLSGCSVLNGNESASGGGAVSPTTESPMPTASPDVGESPTPTPTPMPTLTGTDALTPTPTATPTPAPTPTPATTPTPTPDDGLKPISTLPSLPSGVTADGVKNVTTLYRGHEAQLAGSGFRYTITVENSSWPGVVRFVFANDTSATLADISATAPEIETTTNQTYYYGPELAGSRNASSGEIAYSHGPTNIRSETQFTAAILSILPRAYIITPNWTVAGGMTVDGEQRLVLTADSLRQDDSGFLFSDSEFDSFAGRMTMTPDGLVRSLRITTANETADGETVTMRIDLSVSRIETGSLSPPAWLDEPPQLAASTAEDGQLLVVEHTGGAAIDARTNLTVGRQFSGLGNVTLDSELAAGDTVYVYRVEGELRAMTGARPGHLDDASAFVGQVAVSGSQGPYRFAAGVEIER